MKVVTEKVVTERIATTKFIVLSLSLGLLMVLLSVPTAFAQKLDGKLLFATKTCLACHGADANTPLLPDYPKLAGQSRDYLLKQMIDIKSGARKNGNAAAMAGVMPLVNEQEMAAIADWLASLK